MRWVRGRSGESRQLGNSRASNTLKVSAGPRRRDAGHTHSRAGEGGGIMRPGQVRVERNISGACWRGGSPSDDCRQWQRNDKFLAGFRDDSSSVSHASQPMVTNALGTEDAGSTTTNPSKGHTPRKKKKRWRGKGCVVLVAGRRNAMKVALFSATLPLLPLLLLLLRANGKPGRNSAGEQRHDGRDYYQIQSYQRRGLVPFRILSWMRPKQRIRMVMIECRGEESPKPCGVALRG